MHLLLLGSPTLQTDDGHLSEFDTRKALALLAYLALHDQPFQRDTLASLFWPELDQSRARAALRRTLTPLNHAMGEEALITTRDTIELNPDYSLWVDTRGFEATVHAAQNHQHAESEICEQCYQSLVTAVNFYKGDFMAGFTLRDAPEFDDWQFFEADRLRRLYATALERLIPLETARGDFDPAIERARRWLALDPLHEPAHRVLMRLYAQTDQRAAALRQYRECVRILDEELGVSPLEETKQLYEEILENRGTVTNEQYSVTSNQSSVGGVQSASQQITNQPNNERTIQRVSESPNRQITNPQLTINNSFPLTGRVVEWNTLLTAYVRPSPDGFFIGIEGEAGVGKTRLVEDFLAQVQAMGAITITARCYRGEEQLAYGPFAEGIRGILGRPDVTSRLAQIPAHWLAETAHLLPEISDPHYPLSNIPSSPGTQTRLFEGMRQSILALSAGHSPGVLFIDDLQWADTSSLDLLIYLVRRLQDFPVILIAAWRKEGDLSRQDHVLADAQRSGTGGKITLERLTQADVENLAFEMVPSEGISVSAEWLHTLYEETEGLPYFVVEYLSAARQKRDWSTLQSVQDLERARLTGLDETSRQVLATAAVIGRSFEFDTLREASGRSEEETVSGLEALLSRGLLIEHRQNEDRKSPSPLSSFIPSYDFSHEKIRSVVYEDTSLARRRLLHRRVAEVLLSSSRSSVENAARIAYHFQRAGQDSEAARYYRLAGDHARKLYANTESLSHYQTALALGHPEPALLNEIIGDLQTFLGDYRAAVTSYETSAALSEARDVARVEHKLGNLHHRRGDYDLASSFFQTAFETAAKLSKDLQPQILADWSRTCARQNDLARADELAEEALALSNSPLLMGQARNVLGMIARQRRDLSRAADHLQQALSIAETEGYLPAHIAALNNLALLYEDQGDYARAVELAQNALDLCARLGDRHREAALRNRLADLFHASNQPSAAMYHLKKAVEIFAEIGGGTAASTPVNYEPEIWKLTEW